jgi:putative transcriptional regulator
VAREHQIAGGLLIAMPQLVTDPNFARSVVLMIEHTDEGSLGLVVNRPLELSLGDVMRTLDLEWEGDPEDPVYSGGPVQPQSGWVLHEPVELPVEQPSLSVSSGIQLSTSPEQLRELAAAPPDRVRFLLGYAGWAPGQLEGELAAGAWLLAPSSAQLVFETPAESIWETAIRSLGIEPATLIPGGGVH